MTTPRHRTMTDEIVAMAEAAEADDLLTALQLNLQERGWLLLKRHDDTLDGFGPAAFFVAHDEDLHRMLDPVLEEMGVDLIPLADALPTLRLLPGLEE